MRSSKAYIGTVMGIIMYSAFSEVNARFVIKQMECAKDILLSAISLWFVIRHYTENEVKFICLKITYR